MTSPAFVASQIRTARTATFVRELALPPMAPRASAEPVLLIHGNLSSSVFFGPLMGMMPRRYRPLAVDLRGFGGSDPEPVDAARGVRDFSDDVLAAMDALDLDRVHVLGWSLGGLVAMQATIDAPQRFSSMTLLAPISPYGFGGTVDARGTLLAADGAGSGAGLVSPALVRALADRDASEDNRAGARALLRRFYLGIDPAGPSPLDRPLEDELVGAILTTVLGPDNYPGDRSPSPHWPGFAPGVGGVMNAISPLHSDASVFANIEPKPPVLWVRGAADMVISDSSTMDAAVRGARGSVDGFPGIDQAPPQPMLAQTRAVLDGYAAGGGRYREVVIEGAGHAPHLTALPELMEVLVPHLDGAEMTS